MRTGCQLGWILASKIHQNLLLNGSWPVLWPSWAVLGRLGGLLRRLEEASKNDAKKECKKNASSGVFGRFGGGGSTPAHGRGMPGSWRWVSVRSPKLSFTNKKKPHNNDKDERRKTKDEKLPLTPSRRARWRIILSKD